MINNCMNQEDKAMQRIIISCKFYFESFNKGENPIHKTKTILL